MKEQEKSPKTVDEQEKPQQERMTTPDEEEGMDLKQLEEPPQAEGPRGREDAGARRPKK